MRKDTHAREYEQDDKMAFFRAPRSSSPANQEI